MLKFGDENLGKSNKKTKTITENVIEIKMHQASLKNEQERTFYFI